MTEAQGTDRGRTVTAAGTGINLALGVLYTWSIFKGAIRTSIEEGGAGSFDWELSSLNDPYAVCCLVFACTMIVAGKCQDRCGPRLTAVIGGILVGAGFVLISTTTAYVGWILGFGFLVGTGIAFGYSSATPAALKWFPPTHTGKIAGIVVSGFGLASVYIAPLATYLLGQWGLEKSMLFFGIAFLVIVISLAMLLRNPPEGHVPAGFVDRRKGDARGKSGRAAFRDDQFSPMEMVRDPSFWALWTLYFIGAGAGLMVIGSIAGMAKRSLGEQAFLAVAILAVGNAAGRIAAGTLSDRIGRSRTLSLVFVVQALLMLTAIPVVGSEAPSSLLVVLLATFIGFNYGANLALFPSFTKDLWGMKHFGVNYGILFTAWGIGGFVLSRVSQTLAAESGSFTGSFAVAGILLLLGVLVIFFMKDHKEAQRKVMRRKGVLAG
jgi:nitrate/nitrite transporter NarK